MTAAPPRRAPGANERRARLRRGRFAELIAAAALMAKGYRILGRNVKTRAGEIDIVAVRGKRLAFVEVKRRLTSADAEAAVSGRQAARISATPPTIGSPTGRAITATSKAMTSCCSSRAAGPATSKTGSSCCWRKPTLFGSRAGGWS